MSMLARGPDTAKDAADEAPKSTTRVQYNQWLIKSENQRMAEEKRSQAKEGDEFIKNRKREHTAMGLSRQQSAMSQMKRATEAVEKNRQNNLVEGRKLYEQRNAWVGDVKKIKDEWIEYGKSIRETQKTNNFTTKALAESAKSKKDAAAITRSEDNAKKAELEKWRKEKADEATARVEAVKKDTADSVVDESKRVFYEQRRKIANDVRQETTAWTKERQAKDNTYRESQQKKRVKAKEIRDGASKSREALLAERAAEAAAVREQKKALAEKHKTELQNDYLTKQNEVKRILNEAIYVEGESPRSFAGSPRIGSPKSPKARVPTATGSP